MFPKTKNYSLNKTPKFMKQQQPGICKDKEETPTGPGELPHYPKDFPMSCQRGWPEMGRNNKQ